MNDKAAAARAEAQRCVALSRQNTDSKTRECYLQMARSWMLIAEHHEVLAEVDGKARGAA